MILKTRWLWLAIGRDYSRMLPASIHVAVLPRPDLTGPGYLLRALVTFTASWSWRPYPLYEITDPNWNWDNSVWSGAWTGRSCRMLDFLWPHHFAARFDRSCLRRRPA